MIGVSIFSVQGMISVGPCWSSLEADLCVVWIMTGSFEFSDEIGRTAWEVKGRAVLGIGELHCPNVEVSNVWIVRVEVV